ncbi:MAG: hypothetical protein V1708_00180 [Candidatus Micrarchaeota archaeon]
MASAMSMFSGEPQATAQAQGPSDTGEAVAGGSEAGSGSSEDDEGPEPVLINDAPKRAKGSFAQVARFFPKGGESRHRQKAD